MPKARRKSTWGGRREGAGRKPNGAKAGVSHLRRPVLTKGRKLVQVTMRFRKGLPSLKRPPLAGLLRAVIEASEDRFSARVVKFTVEPDELRLVVQTDGPSELSRAMQGLSIRIARGVNRVLGREGTVFSDRYDLRVL
jgi:hypothetical protein